MTAAASILTPHMAPCPVVTVERAEDARGVDALTAAAFGPGRFAKTAERLREGARPAAAFVAHEVGTVVGSVRLWSVTVGEARAMFLGPIAVDAGHRKGGLGAALVEACIAHARASDVAGILLVGDLAYFDRFGFAPAPDAVLPGPVDRRRVLWLGLDLGLGVDADTVAGVVRQADRAV